MNFNQLVQNAKWNLKFYGNYVYLNGRKTLLSDEQKQEAVEHIKSLATVESLIKNIKVVPGGSNSAFHPTGVARTADWKWLLNVKVKFGRLQARYVLFFNMNEVLTWTGDVPESMKK